MIPTKVVHCKRSKKLERGTSSLMRKVTCLRACSPVETFYKQDIPCTNGSSDAVAYRTDIYMLFNQQRFDRMTLSQFSDWLDNQVPSSGLSELRSKMSDAQLFEYIKPRYIQSPSELMAWAEYLSSEFDSEVSRINAEALEKAAADSADSSSGSADPVPAASGSE